MAEPPQTDPAGAVNPSVFALLRRYGLDPKRSLGQNFLIDERHLGRIADVADLAARDTVLEIGPGLGVLTRHLASQAGRVIGVELDGRLIDVLRDLFAGQSHVSFVHGDILAMDPAELVQAASGSHGIRAGYKVVANLPYYITSAVLRHLLENRRPPELAVVMVQKEVAQRICAGPGEMSLLAVGVQFYARPRIVQRVPAGAFHPRPKVDSAVLRLDVMPEPAVAGVDVERFFQIVRAGFGQKRKQLLNSLSAGLGLSKVTVEDALGHAGIDPQRRPQTLSLPEWGRLYQALVD
jgi:16S rRNA (adenine1518-N6/adenine1519-N6)-dimethyltransferase